MKTMPEKMAVSSQEIAQDSLWCRLEESYEIEDRSGVAAFIKRNRLWELLLAARGPLTDAFGESAVKKLTLVEDDEGFITLFCLILIPGSLDEARRALNSFDDNWWLARSGQVDGKLNFDFDLV